MRPSAAAQGHSSRQAAHLPCASESPRPSPRCQGWSTRGSLPTGLSQPCNHPSSITGGGQSKQGPPGGEVSSAGPPGRRVLWGRRPIASVSTSCGEKPSRRRRAAARPPTTCPVGRGPSARRAQREADPQGLLFLSDRQRLTRSLAGRLCLCGGGGSDFLSSGSGPSSHHVMWACAP